MQRGDNRLLTSLSVVDMVSASVLAIHAFAWFDPQHARVAGVGDSVWFSGPYAFFQDACTAGGEFPLWNPLLFCGVPFAANPQAMAFYPPNILRSLLAWTSCPIETHYSLAAMIALHLVLCGSVTYLLMRSHSSGRLTSALAAMIVLQGFPLAISPLTNPIYVLSFAWTPLVLLCLRRASQSTGRHAIRWIVAGGLAFGMELLAGFPQLATCTAGVGAGYYFLNLVFSDRWPSEMERQHRLRRILRVFPTYLFSLFLLFAIAALVAAALLIPGRQFGQSSSRWRGAAADYPENLGSFFPGTPPDAPSSSLDLAPAIASVAKRMKPPLQIHAFFLLAVVAALVRGGRRTWILLISGLIALDFALGPPMPLSVLTRTVLPWEMSVNGALWLVSSIMVSLLAAHGLGASWESSMSRRRRACVAAAIAGAALVALAAWAGTQGLEAISTEFGSREGFVALTGVVILVACFLVQPRPARWLAGVLCLLGVIAAETEAERTFGELENVLAAPGSTLHDRPSFWSDEPRGLGQVNHCLYALRPIVNGADSLQLGAVATVLKNPGTERQYERCILPEAMARNPHVDLFLTRAFWLARTYSPGALPGKDRLFRPSRVVFLPEAKELPVPEACSEDIEQPWQGEGVREERIWQKDSAVAVQMTEDANGFKAMLALSEVHLSGQQTLLRVEGTGDLPEAIDLDIVDRQEPECAVSVHPSATRQAGAGQFIIEWPLPDAKSVDIRLGAAVRSPGRCEITSVATVTDLEDERALVRLVDRGANEVEVETRDLPAARILLFTDAYYPGWQAEVDGQPVPIYRANDAFKAVMAPAGTHRIRFVFRPRLVWVGLSISTVATLAALAYLCWPWATAFFTRRHGAR